MRRQRAAATETNASTSQPVPADVPRPRVLIADADAKLRSALREWLELRRMDVVGELDNGHDIVAKSESLSADVVVLDIRLPGISALTVSREIVDSGALTQTVLLASFDPSVIREETTAAGVYTAVLKSEPKLIVSAIVRAFAHRQALGYSREMRGI